MNELLNKKYNLLKEAEGYQCWYIVKQPTDFAKLCYLVSALEDYQKNSNGETLGVFISQKLSTVPPELAISDNYRALRVAAYVGLIKQLNGYEKAEITPVFKEIEKRTNGAFEKTELYSGIIEQQIEKIFFSSEIDKEKDGVRKAFRLYPVMLLYKVLLEIGRVTGNYRISMDEYRYFVTTTERYTDFLSTLLYIQLCRDDSGSIDKFKEFRGKIDNRVNQVIAQLPKLLVTSNDISIKPGAESIIAKKIFVFEEQMSLVKHDNYIDFLCSNAALVDVNQLQSNKSRQRIFFGAPGTGKSYSLKKEANELVYNNKEQIERVTFHPDYTYANFVGSYKPIMKTSSDDSEYRIAYEYVPGPFMRTLAKALKNPDKPYVLIVEEINRANVAAVFGDVFQLLDRTSEGISEYSITTSDDMRAYLAKEEIDGTYLTLPSNMFIWATMNSADQGVYPMDTAFKRRWSFKYIGIDDEEDKLFKEAKEFKFTLGGERVSWNVLRKAINEELSSDSYNINEDKLMGPFFLTGAALKEEKAFREAFKNKVLMYLFDDVVKQKRRQFFKNRNRYSEICKAFDTEGLNIFPENVINFVKEHTTKEETKESGDEV